MANVYLATLSENSFIKNIFNEKTNLFFIDQNEPLTSVSALIEAKAVNVGMFIMISLMKYASTFFSKNYLFF